MIEVSEFTEIEVEFTARIQKAVYCSMATVDRQGRPRSRILHPIWDGPIGWAISWPESHKAKHLENNPYVSLAYIADRDKPAYVDALAEWVNDEREKHRIWNLYQTTPPPLGFDPDTALRQHPSPVLWAAALYPVAFRVGEFAR